MTQVPFCLRAKTLLMTRQKISVSGKERDMITEIITFAIPDGMTRDEVVANSPDEARRHGVPIRT